MRFLYALLLIRCASASTASDLSVFARAVGSGVLESGERVVVVEARVENRGAAAETVNFMSEGWFSSWLLEPSEGFRACGWNCSANFPSRHVIGPGRSLVFTFAVGGPRRDVPMSLPKFRVGFAQVRNEATDLDDSGLYAKGPAIWSNVVSVPPPSSRRIDASGTYREIPNKSVETTRGTQP